MALEFWWHYVLSQYQRVTKRLYFLCFLANTNILWGYPSAHRKQPQYRHLNDCFGIAEHQLILHERNDSTLSSVPMVMESPRLPP